MTAARQQRKSPLAVGLALGLAVFGPIFVGSAISAPNDPVVVNASTGLAISGFDPVAYFVDGKPKIGRANFELRLDGVVWRFINKGNRAAFAENPEVYRPRFGGYDPVAIARGNSVPGHPLFWAVDRQRLYLFYSAEARATFLAEPAAVIERATRKWPAVLQTIAP
ncbi:MAG TPA: YHS domain-containing (seleno)protein [Pseudolabrys sp.]|nr:YHS domain-containing (seleno)protein [Pseudolabrys sp.]